MKLSKRVDWDEQAFYVFEDKPRIREELRSLGSDKVIFLPYIVGGTVEARVRVAIDELTVENIIEHMKDGSLLKLVSECSALISHQKK